MNINQQQNSESKNPVFTANPVVRQLNKVEERAKKGEDGYYFDMVSFEPGEDGQSVVPAVSGIDYNVVYTTMDESYASCDLSAVSTVEQDEAGHIAVLCELTNIDGTMARLPGVTAFGIAHGFPVISIEDISEYRQATGK